LLLLEALSAVAGSAPASAEPDAIAA
jgi:hypothetical protein